MLLTSAIAIVLLGKGGSNYKMVRDSLRWPLYKENITMG